LRETLARLKITAETAGIIETRESVREEVGDSHETGRANAMALAGLAANTAG